MHTVTEHLNAVDLHIPQISSRVGHFQRLQVNAVIGPGAWSFDAAPQVNVDGLKEGLPLVAKSQGPVKAF